MFIESVALENWKCFADKVELSFSDVEIFSFPNGAGKTSVLEGIIYGLYGKTDSKLALYKNHDGLSKVSVRFEDKGDSYAIDRTFFDPAAKLYKNGELIREGITEVFNYVNALAEYSLVKKMWFKGEISDSEILTFKFFKESILAEKLDTPMRLKKLLTQAKSMKRTQRKGILTRETRAISEIDNDLSEIRSKLKERSNASDAQYARALKVAEAAKKLEEFEYGFTPISQDHIMKWKAIDLELCEKKYEEEKSKVFDETLSSIPSKVLKSLVAISNDTGHCPICSSTIEEEVSAKLNEIVSNGIKDTNAMETLLKRIEFKKHITEEQIKKSELFYEVSRVANSMPNYDEIIQSYSKENDALWQKFDSLTKEREAALSNESLKKQAEALDNEITELTEQAKFVTKYLELATESYTKSLLTKASSFLESLNPEYKDITISGEDATIEVDIKGEKLSIGQLSRGERTMVALAMIYTVRDIFIPNVPLLFDESFASLSEANNKSVIEAITSTNDQVFVVTHNENWVTYPDYPDGVNVRTEWGE